MKTRMLVMGSLSALVLGGTMVGCTAQGGGIASASSRSEALAAKTAARDAAQAGKALADKQPADAVRFAEGAVGLMPQNAGYRALLGQSYLSAGRFLSARTAYGEALSLTPGDGKVALNYALAQIGTGDWPAARQTLTTYAEIIPASDRGLALALAGDPAGGAALLTEVARSDATSVKVRQNLALTLALAGQWQSARVVAAADLSPGDLDARMEQWAAFSQPQNASDQVATLLGVKAAADTGQPIALALNAPVAPTQSAAAEGETPAPTEAPAEVAAVAAPTAAPVAVVAATPGVANVANISFGPRAEVVQPLPAAMLKPAAGPMKVALAKAAPARPVAAAAAWAPAKGGTWFVQLGAFESAGVAHDAWGRATKRMPLLAQHAPNGVNFAAKAGQFYRLSVGGFSRADADQLCRRYRASGGVCFVRAGAGDQMAKWVRPTGVQVASR